jgi:hypothetical protein
MWTPTLSIVLSISYFISPWFKNVLGHDLNPRLKTFNHYGSLLLLNTLIRVKLGF